MKILPEQAEMAVNISLTFLNYPRSPEFRCVDFVRAVYRQVGIIVPHLGPHSPPSEFNISHEELNTPPAGHMIFLRDMEDERVRAWTHTAIILPECKIIHCSLFFGEKVIITPLEEIWRRYEFAPSFDTQLEQAKNHQT